MPKVVLSGYIIVPDGDLGAVLGELPTHIELTRMEEGCLRFDVGQDPENPDVFNVYEEFVDRVAFEFHQQRVRMSSWAKITNNVARHYKVTEDSLPFGQEIQ